MTMASQHTAGLLAVDQRTLADLTLEIQASRQALAKLLRSHRALRRRWGQVAGPPLSAGHARLPGSARKHGTRPGYASGLARRTAPAPPAPDLGAAAYYFVERGVHTRHGTFTALLTPVPTARCSTACAHAAPGAQSGPPPAPGPAIKVETALDCWWAWRHPNMTATIAARRSPVLWLDFHYPETGARSDPFPAYRVRYDQARLHFGALPTPP